MSAAITLFTTRKVVCRTHGAADTGFDKIFQTREIVIPSALAIRVAHEAWRQTPMFKPQLAAAAGVWTNLEPDRRARPVRNRSVSLNLPYNRRWALSLGDMNAERVGALECKGQFTALGARSCRVSPPTAESRSRCHRVDKRAS